MDTLIEKFEKDGYVVEYHIEPDPQNPREDETVCKIITSSRNYGHLGDINLNNDDFKSYQDFLDKMKKKHKPFMMLPLYVLDHSSINLQLSKTCPWDSSLIGVILINKKQLKDGWGLKKVTEEHRELALRVIKGELETYNDYLNGNVYGYTISENGEEVNSCWGYYGFDHMKEEVEQYIKNHPTVTI